jgi:hypothetical protein
MALGVAGLMAGLILTFSLARRSTLPTFRHMPPFDALTVDLGRSVEAGTRLHVALGSGSLTSNDAAASLIGLSALSQIAAAGSISDKPPLATSGDGTVALLAQDVLRVAFRQQRAEDRYDPLLGRVIGLGGQGYAAGAMHTAPDEDVTATIILGAAGPEAGLMAEAGARRGTVIGGTLDVQGQTAWRNADHPLIGEELFASGAYLHVNRAHAASLQAQDILRWLVIASIVGLAVVRTLGLLCGSRLRSSSQYSPARSCCSGTSCRVLSLPPCGMSCYVAA